MSIYRVANRNVWNEKCINFYKCQDVRKGLVEEYGMSAEELNTHFIEYMSCLKVDMKYNLM